MAVFGGRVSLRRNVSPGRIIGQIIMVTIVLWVGSEILDAVGDTIDTNTGYFKTAFDFLGMNTDAGADPSGIITVVGILAVAAIALQFININL